MNTLPHQIKLVDIYGGNAVWFIIEQDGKREYFTIDRREGSRTLNRLFMGARHPANSKAILLELGSEEEGGAISGLSEWLDSDTPKNLGLTDYGWELIRDTLDDFGSPTIG